ncbi:MAG: hypothetical protein WDW36_003380 [Sanguina aurantia]
MSRRAPPRWMRANSDRQRHLYEPAPPAAAGPFRARSSAIGGNLRSFRAPGRGRQIADLAMPMLAAPAGAGVRKPTGTLVLNDLTRPGAGRDLLAAAASTADPAAGTGTDA